MSLKSTICFPDNTCKLRSKMLKRPPTPIDWIRQSYMDMIEDIPFTTDESEQNDVVILDHLISLPKHKTEEDDLHEHMSAIDSIQQNEKYSTVTIHLDKSKIIEHYSTEQIPSNNQELIDSYLQFSENDNESKRIVNLDDLDDDNESVYCYTYTTSSTDYNRSNNVFKFYQEYKQNLICPIDEEVSYVITSDILSGIRPTEKEIENEKTTKVIETVKEAKPITKKTSHKKRFKIIGKIIIKMGLSVEKPFKSIDKHF